MLRLRIAIPLLLSSLASAPAVGEYSTSHCTASPNSPRCEAERAREFAAARNAEINASIAAVNAQRAWLVSSRTHCKTSDSTTPRCEAERAREFALTRTHCKTADSTSPRCQAEQVRELAAAANAQMDTASACQPYNWLTASCETEGRGQRAAAANAQMDTASACQPYNWLTASCAAKRELALARTHCKTADSTSPRCEAERARELAAARSGEINTASACQPYNWLTASCKPERNGEQVAARNEDTANACQSYNWLTASCATKRELALARTHCKTADSTTPRCEAERAREFAAARNAEINASIAAVNAERAHVLALSRTHCKTADSTTPRCEAERAREFAEVRNAEINASIAAVNAERARAFAAARNAEISASIAAVNAQRAPAFAAARNAEINASIAAVAAERARAFAAARNAEINASIAAVAAERARAFAATRNAEINASIAAVNALRGPAYTPLGDDVSTAAAMMEATQAAFVAARNAEIDASIAAVNGERARAFAAARNAEIEASIAAVNAQRAQAAFAAARNAEINASIAAVATQRALRAAEQRAGQTRVETGAISLPDIPVRPDSAPIVRRTRNAEPCREAGRIMSPLQFSDGRTDIEQAMKPELDRIAMMARTCPAIRIEIHGHSDNSATTKVNRYLAQRRADAAVTYLVQAGVGRDRLAAIGHAEAQPVAPNTNAQNRARNRRIEVMIKDPATDAAAQRVMWDLAELLDPTYVPPLARLSP